MFVAPYYRAINRSNASFTTGVNSSAITNIKIQNTITQLITIKMEYTLSSLPTVKPKWKRTIQTIDIQPIDGQCSEHICTTCNKNKARYSCPKCAARYCSVECYRVHDVPAGKNREGGGRCTEQFYREKVIEVTDLHVKDEKNIRQMRDILTRTFYDDGTEEEGSEGCKEDNMPTNLSDQDVVDLIKCGMKLGDMNEIADCDVDIDSVPDDIIRKFEVAVQRGELSHIVKEWNPLSSSSNEEHEEISTLDERILSIPSLFATGGPRKPKVQLEHNVCEVIFVIAWTLRLHDCFEEMIHLNSHVPEDTIQIALHLHAKSHVLANDARYDSLKHVLMDCCQRIGQDIVQNRGVTPSADSDKVKWRVLTNDLVCICRSRRMTLKALFYANDVVDKAMTDLKQHHGKYSKDSRKKLFLAKKKLQYFLSWCHSYWDSCSEEVTMCIEEWINDWNPGREEGEALSKQDDMLLLDKAMRLKNMKTNSQGITLSTPDTQKQLPEPLLIPIKTKKL